MSLARLGLKPKIAFGFGSLLAIIALIGVVGYRAAVLNEQLAQEAREDARMMEQAHEMLEAFLLQRIGTRDVLMGRDQETTHLFEHGEADFRDATDKLKPLLSTDASRGLYAKVELTAADYLRRNEKVVAMYRSGDAAGALGIFKAPGALAVTSAMKDSLNDLTSQIEADRHAVLAEQVDFNMSAKRMVLLLALGGLALGLGIAYLTAYSIVRAIRRMLSMIDTVSSNNLMAGDMEVSSGDEMGKAAHGLNKMKNSLRDLILAIASTAEEVSGSSRDISATASQAAGSAENQKQQVEQIATTMQEMAATVREVSHHAITAARSAESAANTARDGGGIVDDVLDRMRGIAQSVGESAAKIEHLGSRSNEIGRIVGVIDEIATQTNLLALNAAIEAARAGEQGRGFAVVAGEVRRLAERTTVATREIAGVIESLQTVTVDAVRQMRSGTAAVEHGVEVAGLAGESIKKIIREAENVGMMVAQIASAATQQATATEEVNASMVQISELAADAAEGSQLSAKACGQLFDQALGLQTMVDRFEVGQRKRNETVPAVEHWGHAA
ncbi:MAG: methyl-accepting chemotaxis protein [Acidobacteriota bacterium]|nr:methyl-accepting chemotaxis protein [Acidobacteriota bacterium]